MTQIEMPVQSILFCKSVPKHKNLMPYGNKSKKVRYTCNGSFRKQFWYCFKITDEKKTSVKRTKKLFSLKIFLSLVNAIK